MMKSKVFKVMLILILLSTIWLFFNLDIGNKAQPADVIIVNEGLGPERAYEGVRLMQAGYADRIIVSPPHGETDDYDALPYYYEAGAIEDDLVLEMQATSTWTNAIYSIELMEEKGWKTALVVSSDYHMRRVKLSYERASQGKDLKFIYVSAYPMVEGQAVAYNRHPINFYYALNELWKYPGYLLALYHWLDL